MSKTPSLPQLLEAICPGHARIEAVGCTAFPPVPPNISERIKRDRELGEKLLRLAGVGVCA